MRIFALGGYGKVGLPAIKLLAGSDLVTEIAIAGRSQERAEKAATELAALERGEKALAIQVDGTDEGELTSLLAGYDIIMNAATNEAVLPAIRAATRTGAHYCDVAYGDVLDRALQLAAEAEAAGITSVLANGVHPSITNLMGVHVGSVGNVERCPGLWAAVGCPQGGTFDSAATDHTGFKWYPKGKPTMSKTERRPRLTSARKFKLYLANTLSRCTAGRNLAPIRGAP